MCDPGDEQERKGYCVTVMYLCVSSVVLSSLMSAWHKLESSVRREPQLRRCLWDLTASIFLISGSQRGGVVQLFGVGDISGLVTLDSIRMQAEHTRGFLASASAPACRSCPVWFLPWWAVVCKPNWPFPPQHHSNRNPEIRGKPLWSAPSLCFLPLAPAGTAIFLLLTSQRCWGRGLQTILSRAANCHHDFHAPAPRWRAKGGLRGFSALSGPS